VTAGQPAAAFSEVPTVPEAPAIVLPGEGLLLLAALAAGHRRR